MSDDDRQPNHPVYMFHNSWFLRAPVIKGSKSGQVRLTHLHVSNNAIQYCDPDGPKPFCRYCPGTPVMQYVDWAHSRDWSFDYDCCANTRVEPRPPTLPLRHRTT